MQATNVHPIKGDTEAAMKLSVVVAVSRNPKAAEAIKTYRAVLDGLDLSYEILCMTNPDATEALAGLSKLTADWPELTVFERRPWSGEDGELATAYKRAKGDLVLTLPEWPELAPEELNKLFEAIDGQDMVVCARDNQPIGGTRQALMQRSFRLFFGHTVSDVFCRVRLCRRDVLEEIGGFGVRQHFIPVIAASRGYRVTESQVKAYSGEVEAPKFVFKPMGHLRALFDAVTLFVVLKFLYRPLRFFGSIGLPIFLIGAIYTAALLFGRLFLDVPLADRPALIFSVLMIVLGVQIIALGLVGEIIIFSNSRQIKQYKVSKIIKGDGKTAREIPQTDDD